MLIKNKKSHIAHRTSEIKNRTSHIELRKSFHECYNQYFDAIRSYLYYRSGDAELATDIAQEVFLKLWAKQIPFEGKRTKSLLYKMAGDLFISHLRKNKVANSYALSLQLDVAGESPEASLHYKELKNAYENALGDLPEKQRSVFLMSRMEELTYKEIAERLKLSVKAVEKRMSIAITSLKSKLGYHARK